MNIAINGFGRIGREIFRIAYKEGIQIVAVNSPSGSENGAYLLKYDSVHGQFKPKVEVKHPNLVVGGKKTLFLSERDPEKLPWRKLKIDLVIESSGRFSDRREAKKHINAGARKVLITAPSSHGPDITICPGVNEHHLDRHHKIISLASCTTNCLAPIAKLLNDRFKIKSGLMTTIHAYTNDQEIQDSFHKKFRRGRAGAINIIPTTTEAAKAVCEVLPELKGKLTGLAVRVPVASVSLIDLVVDLERTPTKKQVNDLFKHAAKEQKKILGYTEEPLVSSDFIGNSKSAIIDGLSTEVKGSLVKVLAWYDNEYGYSSRVVDAIKLLKKL